MKRSRRKFTIRLTSFVLALVLVMGILPHKTLAVAYNPETGHENLDIHFWEDKQPDIGFYINASAKYIIETVPEPKMGSTFGEWSVMDLLRGMYTGYDYVNHIPPNYFEGYVERIENYVKEKEGNLNRSKSTEWSRLMLTLTSLGYDVTEVAEKYDFIEKLSESHKFSHRQGINGPIWEIIAMNTGGYDFIKDDDNPDINTFGKMIDYILEREITQKDGTIGGWALYGNSPDVDITGMALQALAPYYLQESEYNKVREEDSLSYEEFAKVVERGVFVLSEMQKENGGYNSWGSMNSESISQVIVALTALDIDPLAKKIKLKHIGKECGFVTDGAEYDGVVTDNMIDALLTFWANGSGKSPESSGFKHVTTGYDGGGGSGTGVNAMATDQALYGLIAYDRYKKGEKPLYDMRDMNKGEYKEMLSESYRESKSYKVTYCVDGETKTELKSPYAAIKLPEGDSTSEKIFKNWNTKDDGDGTMYKAGDYLSMPKHDITLYAQYRNKDEFTTIEKIKPVNNVLVNLRTTKEEAKEQLSKTTKIIDSEDEEYEVDLTWNIESYNGNKIGNYIATGTFELPDGVRQSDPAMKLEVTAEIKVSKQIPESELDFDKKRNTIIGYNGNDKDVVIPKEIGGSPVTKIGIGAFQDKKLNTIYIPNSVTVVEKDAFRDNKLVEVNIPNSIDTIEDGAFRNNQLSKIRFSDSLLSIENNAFRNNKLTELNIPNGLIDIGDSAFRDNQLTKVHIPNSVIRLENSAFRDNDLIEVNISSRIKEIGSYVFYNNKLEIVDIPNGVEMIGVNAFSNNQLTEINLPDGVTTLKNGAFSSNRIKEIKIPEKTTDIGVNAFANNNILKESAIIDNYKENVEIGKGAFTNNGSDGKTEITPIYLKDEAKKLVIDEVELLKDGKLVAKGKMDGAEITIQLPKDFSEDEVDKISLGSYKLKIFATEGANVKQDGGAQGNWSDGIINTVDVDSPTKFIVEKYGIEKEYTLTIKSPEKEPITVVSVEKTDDIEVELRTEKENIELPEKITLNLSDGSTEEVGVTWTSEEYDGNKAGDYSFIGDYELPEGVTGEEPEARVKVIVKEELEPEPGVDRTKLEEIIKKGKELDIEGKTEESVKILEEAISKGKEIFEREEVTQEELDSAAKAIEDAIDKLESEEEPEPEPEVDRTKLEEIIEKGKKIEIEGKTEENIKALEEAIAKGKEIFEKEEVTQEELDSAAKAIEDAINNLEDKEEPEPEPEVDRTKLEEVIKKGKEIDIEGKTEESIKILEEAIAKGKEIFEREEVTQEELDSVVKTIEDAIEKLESEEEPEPKPELDKTKLEEIINKGEEVDTEGKTEESVKALEETIAKGKEILGKEKVTQEELDSVVKAIANAINNLENEEKPTEPTKPQKPGKPEESKKPNKPQKPSKTGITDKPDKLGKVNKQIESNKTSKPEKTVLPKTGESSNRFVKILGGILLLVGVGLWINKRKEKKRKFKYKSNINFK